MAIYTNEDIIRYVEGELSSEEKQKMEDDLRADVSLAAGVELYRQLKETLEQRLPADEGATAMQQTLRDMRGKYFGGAAGGGASGGGADVTSPSGEEPGAGGKVVKMKVRADVFRKYVVGLAAAAAILFAVVMLWPSDYLNTYGKTQMVGSAERGEGNDSLMEQASAYFNAGDFEKALPLLDQAFRKDSTNQTALFYRGVALLHTGGVDAARSDLLKVYAGGSLFQYEAAFYLALSYAQQKNNAVAKEWLDKIPAGAPGADKAAGLRRKLGVN
ncbi:tetratricopeptide repeat protein [Flavitalea sp. BT771]|uniref:tetratricopeptide repeat protein n=1 Tax=Flavitalea sp. BT771 TaxID=3063329 RepID=UPI0026E47540|nr:tetratricopeptide repeat protein [Flavitalea sp. BT771]MDO6432395.1 tetratricopeptide repeat protein [Flavitalea sp. BT771]MDV6221305.1 tetratricopeptide repeat protein [Flavitalea sp. BT771]